MHTELETAVVITCKGPQTDFTHLPANQLSGAELRLLGAAASGVGSGTQAGIMVPSDSECQKSGAVPTCLFTNKRSSSEQESLTFVTLEVYQVVTQHRLRGLVFPRAPTVQPAF